MHQEKRHIRKYGVSPVETVLKDIEMLRKAEELMTAIRMRTLSQHSGYDMYRAIKEVEDGQAKG